MHEAMRLHNLEWADEQPDRAEGRTDNVARSEDGQSS